MAQGCRRRRGGERIELFDDTSVNLNFTRDDGAADPVARRHNGPLVGPIRAHHLHLYLVDDAVEEAQARYAATFGGAPGIRWQYDAVDLPGRGAPIRALRRGRSTVRRAALDGVGLDGRPAELRARRPPARRRDAQAGAWGSPTRTAGPGQGHRWPRRPTAPGRHRSDAPVEARRMSACEWWSLRSALAHFVTFRGSTQSQRQIPASAVVVNGRSTAD